MTDRNPEDLRSFRWFGGERTAGLRAFANNQPITHIINSVRAWSLGVPVGSNAWLALVWCLGIVAVFVPLSVRLYRHAASS